MMKIMTKGWCGSVCPSDRAIISWAEQSATRREFGDKGSSPLLPFCHHLPSSIPCNTILQSENPWSKTRSHQQEPRFCLIRRQLDTWDQDGGEKCEFEIGVFLIFCISVFLYFWFSIFQIFCISDFLYFWFSVFLIFCISDLLYLWISLLSNQSSCHSQIQIQICTNTNNVIYD